MLSPKHTNFVELMRGIGGGGGTTVTAKVHESARCWASVAMHLTEVEPIAKLDVVGGLHLKLTGDAPPTIVGAG
jgi:hypothetical protein